MEALRRGRAGVSRIRHAGSPSRRAVAEDLFYRPGTATARAVDELYDAIELAACRRATAAGRPRGGDVMILDVILPTFNREALLATHARQPPCRTSGRGPGGAGTRRRQRVDRRHDGRSCESAARRFVGRLQYLLRRQSRQAARAQRRESPRPTAISSASSTTTRKWMRRWFESICRHFAVRPALDFIGGKCLPLWGAPRPAWLGRGYLGVIGWVDPGPVPRAMDAELSRHPDGRQRRDSPACARTCRSVLDRAQPQLARRCSGARTRTCTIACLRSARAACMRPTSSSTITCQPRACTKRYFRRWCFWRGVSLGVMDRDRPAPVRYLAGVPRYRIGRACRGLAYLAGHALGLRREPEPAVRFEHELACWDLAGFFWGKHLHRVPSRPAEPPGHAIEPRASCAPTSMTRPTGRTTSHDQASRRLDRPADIQPGSRASLCDRNCPGPDRPAGRLRTHRRRQQLDRRYRQRRGTAGA